MADFIQGDYQYTIIDENEVCIEAVDKTKNNYESIPTTVVYNNNTYTITSMDGCFSGCTSFNQTITIPDSVTDMGGCFYDCTSFNQPIIIPNSVTNMGGCFCGCTSFNQSITIPDSVTDMGSCFAHCASFNQLVEIMSDNITNMSYCFYGCEELDQSIIIPEGVENIDSCFEGCLMYRQPVLIPSTVTTMINSFKNTLVNFVAFANVINDRTKTVNCLQVLGDYVGIVFVNDVSYSAWQRNYNFGTTVTEMTAGALRDTFIPIGDYYYNTLFNLDVYAQRRETTKKVYGPIISKFNFPQQTYYTTVLDNTFRECENLIKAPIIPNTVTHMDGCFSGCTSFNQSIIIPDSVEDMSDCFYHCTSFNQSIIIPDSVEDMSGCFWGCTSFNKSITIPNSVEYMNNCFKNCTALSNNITVIGYRSNNGGLFTGTNKPIYLCLGSGSESAANGWRQVAAQYPNVHFEADDHPAPNLTLTAMRGTGTGENWVPSADGDSIKLEATWSINTELLPYGYEVTRNNPQVFLDDNSSGDEFTTNIIYKTLSTEPLNQHTFTAQLSDGYKTATVTAIVTRAGALLDFLGNQNPKSPYVDKPGTGMAIGTFAIRSGLDIQFPTTIGNGLIPPTQPVNPEICESQDSTIDLDKNYYVLGGNKYYRINIIKGTTEENNETVEKPFILTKDSSPVSGKTYYETDDKIEFTQISPITSNDKPAGSGWYEEDTRSPYDNNWYAATQEAVDLNNYQLTIGQYNLQDPGIQSMYGDVALIVGNGADNLHRSNAVTIGKDGLVGAYIDYDTDAIRSTDATGETESQYLTRFAIINSNNNKVTYIDAHKWGHGETVGVFGAQRMFADSPDPIQNQFGLGINNDKSLFVFMSDNAKKAWRDVLNAPNNVLWNGSAIWPVSSQEASFSQTVSSQPTGIVLVWSGYSNGVLNYDWVYTFIPKWHVAHYNGTGIHCPLSSGANKIIASKYVYIYNDHIKGNDLNDDASVTIANGFVCRNNYWALRAVLGV